ncbi:MAG TPA: DNA replication/repair protein RecF [Bacilli bacterium]|nr:DNA replication/repair protein RecF [Bacilli bacterium]
MFYLKEIKLTNFRCYESYSAQFVPHINIIVGNNAVGKTSLVEAIYCLGLTKSHKAANDNEMIKSSEEYAVIKGTFNNNNENDEVILSLTDKGKRITKNNKIEPTLSKYLGYFSIVMFCPEDLGIVNGAPMLRRRFLDVNIGQISKKYLKSLINYRKLLKQRNEVLKLFGEKQGYDDHLLAIITNAMIGEAKVIIESRKEFVESLNKHLFGKCDYISGEKEAAKIVYNPSSNVENLLRDCESKKKIDKMTKTTNWGPHRDDFTIMINDNDASKYASQGQQKTVALSIKLGLADLIKAQKQQIIVILDDVFGELDIDRQNRVLELLNFEDQIFITTTTIDNLSKKILNDSKIIRIEVSGE